MGGLWMPWSLNGMVAEALAYHSDFTMNDNEGTIPQQIAHLEGTSATMRDDLKEARAGLQAKPGDERLAKQVNALERLLNGLAQRDQLAAAIKRRFEAETKRS